MKSPAKLRARGLLFTAGVLFLVLGPQSSDNGAVISPTLAWADDASESSVGLVVFTVPPEVTICFCGSYWIKAEKDFTSYYLSSDVIDLSKYVGRKVTVTGRPYTTTCWGTLLRTCHFLNVESVENVTPLATEPGTWGRIKSLYR